MGKRPVPYKIMDFKHRIVICSMDDIAMTAEGVMSLVREGIYKCWASINPVRLSTWAPTGFAVKDDMNERTHEIFIRNRRDIDFSSAAWAYEKRLKSGDRWYKLTRNVVYMEDGEFLQMDARLSERGDTLTKPTPVATDHADDVSQASPMPQGVKL